MATERFTANSESFETFVEKNPIVSKAYKFAKEAHGDQERDDGSNYFLGHCVEVAKIVYYELKIKDPELIAAALLHDTAEDVPKVTIEMIRAEFGETIAKIDDGVTKIKHEIREEGQDREVSKAEKDRLNEKKVLNGSMLDPRVGILKAAADRVHNMRTLGNVPFHRQIPKAKETLRYAALLELLGVYEVKKELEDTALSYIDPQVHKKLDNLVKRDERRSPLFITNMESTLESLVPSGIKAEVTHRIIGLATLKHKMERTPDVADVNDLNSFRIIVDQNDDVIAADECYKILRVLQERYATIEDQDRFDNFYFKKTKNGYSAIQITINTPAGAVEIAITSKKKEDFNNWGVVSLMRQGQKELSQYSRVLVFTPDNDVKFFPPGATLIDYAYAIDPSFGVRATKALVDGVEREMTYVLKNGENIQIIWGPDRIAPDRSWQNPNYCLPDTLAIINRQIQNETRAEMIKVGFERASQVVEKRGLIDLVDLFSFEDCKDKLKNMLYHIGCDGSLDNLYFQIGSGDISPEKLDEQLETFGISSKNLGLRSILIIGSDKYGIMEMVGAKIKDFQGNVGALNLDRKTVNGELQFNLRLVVEKLTLAAEKRIRKALLQSDNVYEVVVV